MCFLKDPIETDSQNENIISVLIEILLPGGISRWIETAMVDE